MGITAFAAVCGIVAFVLVNAVAIHTPYFLNKPTFTGLQIALGYTINEYAVFKPAAGIILAYVFPLAAACLAVFGKGKLVLTLLAGAMMITGGALAFSTVHLLNSEAVRTATLGAGSIASGVLAIIGGVTAIGSSFIKD